MAEVFASPYANLTPEEIGASLREEISAALQRRYSLLPDPAAARRVEEEWAALQASQTVPEAAALYELTLWLRRRGFPFWLCGSCASSLIFYLLGMTSANPLPPHYYCPQCRQIHWAPHHADGFDLPERRICEEDGSPLQGDGHNIPWQALWSGEADFLPDGQYQMRLSSAAYPALAPFLKNHWLRNLRPDGGAVEPYPNIRVLKLSCLSLVFTIDPEEAAPDFHNVELNASCVAPALADSEALMNPDRDAETPAGTPLPAPRSFAELVYACGLLHSAGVWDRRSAFMVDQLGYSLPDLIAFRDDVFFYLQSHGLSSQEARRGMDQVRRGRGLPRVTEEMRVGRDKWVLDRCARAEYLFSKAHVAEWILYRLKAMGVRTCFSGSYALLRKVLEGGEGVFLLAGRSGMGKTAFALYLAEKMALEDGKRAALFVPPGGRDAITALLPPALLEESRVVVRDDLTPDLSGAAESLRAQGGFDFLIIDPLQQLVRRKRPRAEHMAAVMERLRRLSGEAGAPILATSGLTRCPERRQDHFPRLSDVPLAEGVLPATEAVLLLYRASFYDPGADRDFALCDVQKYPGGVLNTIHLKWNAQRGAFEDGVNPGGARASS